MSSQHAMQFVNGPIYNSSSHADDRLEVHSQQYIKPTFRTSRSVLDSEKAIPPMTTAAWISDQTDNFNPNFYNPFEIKRRKRTTQDQAKALEQAFQINPKPTAKIRHFLAERLSMSARGIQIWFQNRRAKEKKKQQQVKHVVRETMDQQQHSDNRRQHKRHHTAADTYDDNSLLVRDSIACGCSDIDDSTCVDNAYVSQVILSSSEMIHTRSQSSSISSSCSSHSSSYSPPAVSLDNQFHQQQLADFQTNDRNQTLQKAFYTPVSAAVNDTLLPHSKQRVAMADVNLSFDWYPMNKKVVNSLPFVFGYDRASVDAYYGSYCPTEAYSLVSEVGTLLPAALPVHQPLTLNSNNASPVSDHTGSHCSSFSSVLGSLPQQSLIMPFDSATSAASKYYVQKRYSCPTSLSASYSINPALLQQN